MKVGCLCVAHFQHGYLCVLLIMQSKVIIIVIKNIYLGARKEIVDWHNKFKTSNVFTLFLSSACTLEAYTDRQTDSGQILAIDMQTDRQAVTAIYRPDPCFFLVSGVERVFSSYHMYYMHCVCGFGQSALQCLRAVWSF